MTDSAAVPVFRTRSIAAARQASLRILRWAEQYDGPTKSILGATLYTPEEVNRVIAALPILVRDNSVRRAVLEGRNILDLLPLRVSSFPTEVLQDGGIEETFFAVIGSCPASILWYGFRWPSVPERGLQAHAKHAHVALSINSWHDESPTDRHTVFLHSGQRDIRARTYWMAQRTGLHAIGPIGAGV